MFVALLVALFVELFVEVFVELLVALFVALFVDVLVELFVAMFVELLVELLALFGVESSPQAASPKSINIINLCMESLCHFQHISGLGRSVKQR